jgi:hypothetical protein
MLHLFLFKLPLLCPPLLFGSIIGSGSWMLSFCILERFLQFEQLLVDTYSLFISSAYYPP